MATIETYIIIITLVAFSGMFSGLNLGLMGLDIFELKRKVKLGDKKAIKIFPLREKGNLLLCTLLTGNVLVNSVLAIFLGSITVGIVAVIISTSLIVILGEILPQAAFSKYALEASSKITWLIWPCVWLLYPITWPLSKCLDWILGGELPTIYSKKEIQLFLEEHHKAHKAPIDEEEFEILEGGLEFSDHKVREVMTPRVNTYFLDKFDVLTRGKLAEIQNKGHSRIPVFNKTRDKVVGILYVKDLISVNPSDKYEVKDIMRKDVVFVSDSDKLDTILNKFKEKRRHIFIVLDEFKGMAGIITLEDVLEEIVGEIVDEYDRRVDMRKSA
ncbi:hypothetical protein COV11_03620 [Candidatus Woesearchaeota archaeon CG10_big_fil_rev_8_21_14_0_10_30_7]|nr:MAG: hypothetical protein COV11_03620 [Candidatus Woesearchaeota archaeon CG10_big_fil_rev_8_21_14_0_10_30_7]